MGLVGGLLSMFPLWMVGLWLLACIGLAVHVVRTGREMFWIYIILIFQPLGGLVYLVAIFVPELLRGAATQRLSAAARDALDPGREYRTAKQACEETPTVRNQSRLAQAAAALGHHEEAERLFAQAAHGIHAEDPTLLLGRANALLELDRAQEALDVINLIPGGETVDPLAPAAVLALARAHERLGQSAKADAAYAEASERMAGFEAFARYAAFKARQGRKDEARAAIADMDKRLAKLNTQFRKEARHWRDLAAKALAEG